MAVAGGVGQRVVERVVREGAARIGGGGSQPQRALADRRGTAVTVLGRRQGEHASAGLDQIAEPLITVPELLGSGVGKDQGGVIGNGARHTTVAGRPVAKL